MNHFKKVLSPNIDDIENLLNSIAGCKTSEELYAELSGEIIKKCRPNKPKTILRIKFDGSYYYLKVRWKLNLVRTAKDFLQGNMTGCKEPKKYLLLNKYKFKTPELIAYGCVQNIFSFSYSYQITKEIKGAKTINHFLNTKYCKTILKDLSKLIWQLHENKLIYGSKQLHHDNILAAKNNEKIELYLLDPIGLKKSRDIKKRLDDLLSIIYKNNKPWLNEHCIELFLKSYYNFYSNTESKSLSLDDFFILINKRKNSNNIP